MKKNFATYQQTTEYTCGPSAGLMVLHYYGKFVLRNLALGRPILVEFDHSMLPKKQRQQPWIVAYPKE